MDRNSSENSTNSDNTKVSIILAGMTLLYLLAVWMFKYFPSQDGPAHLYNATLIHEFLNPSPVHDIYQKYFHLNTNLDPTWFAHLILVALMYVFDPLTSEKIFLSAYVILFVVSVKYAIDSINPKAGWLTYLAFPLIYSYILNMGFYANSFSYVISFFVLGYWIRHSDNWTFKNLVVFALLVLLLYLFHIVSFAMVFGTLGIFVLWTLYDDFKNTDELSATEIIKKRILLPFIAILPTLILAAMFMGTRETTVEFIADPWLRIKSLIHLDFIASFQLLEVEMYAYFYVFLFVALFIAAMIVKFKSTGIVRCDMLLLASVACAIVFIFAPDVDLISDNGMKGGGYIEKRVMPFCFFWALLWFAYQRYSDNFKKYIVVLSLSYAVIIHGVKLYKTSIINMQIEEYLSGSELIEPHTTLLPVMIGKPGLMEPPDEASDLNTIKRINPFMHAPNHLAVERALINLANYEAKIGYFPIMYHDHINPYTKVDGNVIIAGYEEVNFLDYEERTGGTIDTVLLWLGNAKIEEGTIAHVNYKKLESGYEKFYTSKHGSKELFRQK